MKSRFLTLVFVFASYVGWGQDVWVMDKAHSSIQFNVTHLIISQVTGKFEEFEGKIISSNENFNESNIDFTAQVASINTDNERRDSHLKSDDFFNADQYPKLQFVGKLLKQGDKYVLKGNMTIRDITHPVVFNVDYNGTITDPWGKQRAGFKVSGNIDRFDYGLNWNDLMETGGAIVGKDVEIVCNVELQKQA